MTHFSIDECMRKLNIQDGTRLDKMKELYCHLDKLIGNERIYLTNCISQETCEQASEVDRDVWCGILLRSVKMGMEAELGGAIKREYEVADNLLSKANLQNTGVSGTIEWAACPESEFSFVALHTLTSEEKRQAFQSFNEGRVLYHNVMRRPSDDIQDMRRQFDFECDLMDLDRISLQASSCYFQGVKMNLQMALEDDSMTEKMENEWVSYQKMSPQERASDFNRFTEEIRYVNGLSPRPMSHHNEGRRDNNQNQR